MVRSVWWDQCGEISVVRSVWWDQWGEISVVRSVWWDQCGETSVVRSVWWDQWVEISVVRSVWWDQCGEISVVRSVWWDQCGGISVMRSVLWDQWNQRGEITKINVVISIAGTIRFNVIYLCHDLIRSDGIHLNTILLWTDFVPFLKNYNVCSVNFFININY